MKILVVVLLALGLSGSICSEKRPVSSGQANAEVAAQLLSRPKPSYVLNERGTTVCVSLGLITAFTVLHYYSLYSRAAANNQQ